jgi:hypothetical protein
MKSMTAEEEIEDLKKQLAQQRASSTAVINILIGDLEQQREEIERLRATQRQET